MTDQALQWATDGDKSAEPQRGALTRFLEIMAVVSWIPLGYFGLSLLGYRSAGGPIGEGIGTVLLLVMPWMTLFAALSFLFDQRAARWWVSPSNLAFLALSIGPSVMYGLYQLAAFLLLIGGPMVVD